MKRYITSNPKIMSGKPVISGTRIPISRIIFLLSDGYDYEEIQEEYPHVSQETLKTAVREFIKNINQYYYASQV